MDLNITLFERYSYFSEVSLQGLSQHSLANLVGPLQPALSSNTKFYSAPLPLLKREYFFFTHKEPNAL